MIKQLGTLGQVVAVAEPREAYRQKLVDEHGIPAGNVFARWEEFVKRPKLCDAVVIATMDREHVGPAVACLQLGYDLLLEKPMATTLEDCQAIERAQRKSGAVVGVCHSLRYHRGFRKVRDLVAGGAIGFGEALYSVALCICACSWPVLATNSPPSLRPSKPNPRARCPQRLHGPLRVLRRCASHPRCCRSIGRKSS